MAGSDNLKYSDNCLKFIVFDNLFKASNLPYDHVLFLFTSDTADS
jgi:hypothetical protein